MKRIHSHVWCGEDDFCEDSVAAESFSRSFKDRSNRLRLSKELAEGLVGRALDAFGGRSGLDLVCVCV